MHAVTAQTLTRCPIQKRPIRDNQTLFFSYNRLNQAKKLFNSEHCKTGRFVSFFHVDNNSVGKNRISSVGKEKEPAPGGAGSLMGGAY
jgi:hypothetical protein